MDYLIIGEKSSADFGASVAERTISQPKKKEIKETIPFSNITYDFSAINGELYWEERELKYVFEILADTPQELEAKKTDFASWVMNVMNENIFDPFIAKYHFYGTYSDMDFADEDNVEKTTATVKFSVYPYKIANEETVYELTVHVGETKEIVVENKSSHRLSPTIALSGSISLNLGDKTFNFTAGTFNDEAFKIAVGENNMTFKNQSEEDCTIVLTFNEEVF